MRRDDCFSQIAFDTGGVSQISVEPSVAGELRRFNDFRGKEGVVEVAQRHSGCAAG